VEVHRTKPRDVQHVRGEDLTVRDDHDRVGLERVEGVEALAVPDPTHLEEGKLQGARGLRHGRRRQLRTAPGRTRRVGEDEVHVDVRRLRERP
jgi:hypothetical protein